MRTPLLCFASMMLTMACGAGVTPDPSGGGIGADCAPCVKKAGMNQCKTQYQACGGT